MIEKNIKICDICEKVVAVGKCFICKKDLCTDFLKILQIGLLPENTIEHYKGKRVYSLDTCKECSLKIQKINFNDKEFNKKIKELIEPYLFKKILLEGLENKEESSDKSSLYGMPIVVSGMTTSAGSVMGIAQHNAKAGGIVSVALKGAGIVPVCGS